MKNHRLMGFAFAVAAAIGLAPAQATEITEVLTVERINSDPALTGPAPRSVQLSPDGKRVTFLKGKLEDATRLDLWEYNLADKESRILVDSEDLLPGEEKLSDEEKARRERMRLFAKGIIQYYWGDDGSTLLFPLGGDIFVYNLESKKTKQLTKTDAYETDIKLSPNGKKVSFIRDQNIFAIDIASGKEEQLTFDGKGDIKNGMAEFVAQEEMSRLTGYWWSPDSQKIAYLQVDESPVNIEKRYEINAEDFTVFEQRYPATGTNNVLIKLAVLDVETKQSRWMDVGEETDMYIVRVKWLRDSQRVSYQWMSRDQQTLELRFADSQTGNYTVALTERSSTWINLHKDLRFLKKQDAFIWASERDGYRHLYLYDLDGTMIRQLTQGKWVVNRLYGVDENKGMVYFDANRETPLEQHLYAVELKGKTKDIARVSRITKQAGTHSVTLAKSMSVYVDYFSSTKQPPQVSLRNIDGSLITWLEKNNLNQLHPFYPFMKQTSKAEFGTLKAEDGQDLYYRMYKPTNMAKGKKYPVIVDVYGGPRAQRVKNSWGGRNFYWHQLMANKGFIVFALDNRGSWNRGKAFEDPIYLELGKVEVEDQITGVNWLKEKDFVDANNIGMFGWSYGGYMTIMSMFKEPDVFKAGVSVAPVTDWGLYDTFYTERYLAHPKDNAEGYEASNVFPYLDGLKGNMLVVHGMADDNVLFTNSTKLFKALQDANKPFDMMTYPGSKHSIFGNKTRTHLFNAITDYFEQHLKE